MPENETLTFDGRTASRWSPTKSALDRGERPIDLIQEIDRQLRLGLGRVFRKWREAGVDARDMFKAAVEDPVKLRELIKQTNFEMHARLLIDARSGIAEIESESLVRNFIDAKFEEIRAFLLLDCRDGAADPEFGDRLEAMLLDLTRRALKNPFRLMPRRSGPTPPANLDEFLSTGLR